MVLGLLLIEFEMGVIQYPDMMQMLTRVRSSLCSRDIFEGR